MTLYAMNSGKVSGCVYIGSSSTIAITITIVQCYTAMDNQRRLHLLGLSMQLNQCNMNLALICEQLMQMQMARRQERRFWIRRWITLRPENGAYGNLMLLLNNEDVVAFRNFTRLPPDMFRDLVQRLTPRLEKYNTWFRDSLPVGLKVAITLRHLATGDSYKSLMYLFYVAHNTISLLVRDVCQAIWDEYGEEAVTNPTTPEGWKEVSEAYSRRWNFHHVIGALDGKHIRIKCPVHGGSKYYNYKGYHSIVLLALVDANYKFLWVQVGAPGSASDAQLWNDSSLREAIIENTIVLPDPEPLPADDRAMPYFIIGDNAFALKEWMMKPFAATPLPEEERIFNYRLSRARRCVENAFGILANRWGCLLTALRQQPKTVESIVLACVCLHNMLRTTCPGDDTQLADQEDDQHNMIPGIWREGAALDDMENRLCGNTASRKAKRQRLYLKHYYNSEAGAVPWQWRMVQ
jgi:hypothetical protein